MPTCPFCRVSHRSKRGEHIIPKWVSRELQQTTWEMEDLLTKYIRKSQKYINLTTPLPCSQCNNGWMSDLEDLAKPVLVPLIHGSASTLTLRDQIIIVKWLCKTAMVYDLYSEKQAPRPRYFEDDEHTAFASTLAHVPSYMFFVAGYHGSQVAMMKEDHSAFSVARVDDLQPFGDPVRVYALTLVIKHLVLQICCAKTSPAVGNFYMKDFRPFSSQIGISTDDVAWPPPNYLGDSRVDEFIHRWSDEPPPRPF